MLKLTSRQTVTTVRDEENYNAYFTDRGPFLFPKWSGELLIKNVEFALSKC